MSNTNLTQEERLCLETLSKNPAPNANDAAMLIPVIAGIILKIDSAAGAAKTIANHAIQESRKPTLLG